MRASVVNDPLLAFVARIRADRPWAPAAVVVAAAAHLAIAVSLPRAVVKRISAAKPTEVIDIDVPKPPPPPPPPLEEPDPPQATPRPRAPSEPEPPTEAAKVMTADPKPDEPVDMTNTFVSGDGSSYAGGNTSVNGTNRSASFGRAALDNTLSAPAPLLRPPPPPTPDRSRRPTLAGGRQWSCPFPPEADADGVDNGVATIVVSVDASGRVTSVRVISDPGHGFGAEARRCAYGKPWSAALDHDGNPVAGVATVTVRFVR